MIRRNPDLTAWGLILAAAAIYEVLAADGKMLSHGFARAAKKRPVVTHGLLGLTVLHLLDGAFPGLLPERLDMYRGFGIVHPRKLIRRNHA